jgi:integrase
LQDARKWGDGNTLVFPGERGTKMSKNTLNMALKRAGFSGRHTMHGFRSTAGSLWRTDLKARHEVIEEALAHVETRKVVAAYSRGQYLDERREVMQRWADYLDAARAT